MNADQESGSLPLAMCTREEYAVVARRCGKPAEVPVLLMSNGVIVGRRSNRYFYVSPIAYRVASGRKLSGKRNKAHTSSDRVL
jgi:hypothetical protein